jgi:DNA-binding transcriptional regulator YdaS (Cro superfamily)
MDARALAQRVLARAAARVGGADRLARYLAVEPATLELWLQGSAVPPIEAILRAVDLVIDDRSAFTS